MSAGNTSSAYDFARFDRQARAGRSAAASVAADERRIIHIEPLLPEQTRPARPDAGPAVRTGEKKTLRQRILSLRGMDAAVCNVRLTRIMRVALCCLLMIGMFGIVVYEQARLNEVNQAITDTAADIKVLEVEYEQKQLALDKRVDLRSAEQIAKNDYGMVAVNNSQIYYVALPDDEADENLRDDGNLFDRAGRFFEQLFAYISGN